MTISVPETVCRSCGAPLREELADLGRMPIANAMRDPGTNSLAEASYPLKVLVCGGCRLAQLGTALPPEAHFNGDYSYFSAYSTSWLDHAERFAAAMTERGSVAPGSLVIEVASNDGYLLQYFRQRGTAVLGVDPQRTARQQPRRGGCRPWWPSSARRRRGRSRPAMAGRPGGRQQRAGPCPRPQRLRRRAELLMRPEGCSASSSRTCWMIEALVRYNLSRALLLLVAVAVEPLLPAARAARWLISRKSRPTVARCAVGAARRRA